jgi:hypothetical protein
MTISWQIENFYSNAKNRVVSVTKKLSLLPPNASFLANEIFWDFFFFGKKIGQIITKHWMVELQGSLAKGEGSNLKYE